MTMDPRIAERRRQVAESLTRRRARRLVGALMAAVVLGSTGWLIRSPLFSVRSIEVTGAVQSATGEILAGQGVVPTRPLLLIRPGRVEEALRSDPWVAEASVRLYFPDRVVVSVQEREPIAWVEADGQWALMSGDAVVLGEYERPYSEAAIVRLGGASDAVLSGALQFLDALREDLLPGTEVWAEGGEIWAWVAGYRVRLGRPVEVEAKASAVSAVIDAGQPDGSTITVIAPGHPAVLLPQPLESTSSTVSP